MDTTPQSLVFHRAVPGAITRRRAMAWMAASAALASAGCSPPERGRILPWVDMPEARGASDPVYYASAVLRDGFAQGVLVGTQLGRPIKVEGNPAHPSSLGATDPFGQAAVLQLWDPDRSQAVVQRLAPVGTPNATQAAGLSSWPAFESAWRPLAGRLQAQRGAGLRILSGPLTSPTLRAQLARWLHALPQARWHQHAALADATATEWTLSAFGTPAHPVARFDRARCVVALGGDPFSEGAACVRHAADWARLRREGRTPVLFAVEVAPGLFGGRADRRIALAPREIDALVQRLAADAPDSAFEGELLQAMRAAGPDLLLLPGPGLDAASHAAVHAMHDRAGATSRTLSWLPPLAWAPEAGTLRELVDAMLAGAVDTLVMLDANPVYDAPGALAFTQALEQVRFTVHAATYRDETARASAWHLPVSHAFEQWSDALAHDGTATLLQPAIAPLYDTRALHEIVALLAGEDAREGHALVQATWRAAWGDAFDERWRESLGAGVVRDSAPAPIATPAAPAPRQRERARVPDGELAAVFRPDPSVLDGRHANNAWLQELPRPFTKHTWDNAAFLGPRTADAAGLATGDRVRVSAFGAHVDAPVWVGALHAEGVVTLPLGYGRRAAGRVGNGVGFDAYRVRPLRDVDAAVRLQKLPGGGHAFALTQNTQDPSGREPARSQSANARRPGPPHPVPSLYPGYASPDHAWAMVIDLDACIGCNACTIACQAENNIPVVGKEEVARGHEMHWIRVDRYDSALPGGSIFQPVPCMHCEKAPCELVCPVGATMHDDEGLNVQVYNRCIGTRFCSNNCPYKVRRFNFLQYTDAQTESLKGQRNPEVTVRNRGVMEKCTYCLHRIARARQHAQAQGVPLADGDVVTACQAVCPTQAIHFGDLRDPASEVLRLRASPRHYVLLEELDTRPRTTYLARRT
ncbi:4Fe-4S dicluster domain-containing protein [Ramlibacter sp. USB13]|uniref:4Fe-4S dicluster domain-containing protein n=1 Tax=Ramlibacter cellulosilyticus TaxID=2764187 RepID=A0A923MSY7_9BURK|nr:4Fe-4S dicluster domain-containing protein [Ramlibacter cellulosilyticus]MBC5784049.1 4Fe-4S dicluster domain-containing protein [Ramlibacter cellulosilyticus]